MAVRASAGEALSDSMKPVDHASPFVAMMDMTSTLQSRPAPSLRRRLLRRARSPSLLGVLERFQLARTNGAENRIRRSFVSHNVAPRRAQAQQAMSK